MFWQGVNMAEDKSEDDLIKLGGSIELSGFRDFDGATMIVLKKIIGNYARKLSDSSSEFKGLKVRIKTIHEREKSEKYELSAKCEADKVYSAEVTERNLFFAVDKALKKITSSMQ